MACQYYFAIFPKELTKRETLKCSWHENTCISEHFVLICKGNTFLCFICNVFIHLPAHVNCILSCKLKTSYLDLLCISLLSFTNKGDILKSKKKIVVLRIIIDGAIIIMLGETSTLMHDIIDIGSILYLFFHYFLLFLLFYGDDP